MRIRASRRSRILGNSHLAFGADSLGPIISCKRCRKVVARPQTLPRSREAMLTGRRTRVNHKCGAMPKAIERRLLARMERVSEKRRRSRYYRRHLAALKRSYREMRESYAARYRDWVRASRPLGYPGWRVTEGEGA